MSTSKYPKFTVVYKSILNQIGIYLSTLNDLKESWNILDYIGINKSILEHSQIFKNILNLIEYLKVPQSKLKCIEMP